MSSAVPSQPEARRIHVYADESRINNNRYMLFGGLWVPSTCELALRDKTKAFRGAERMINELKWCRVSRGKLGEYKRFVDLFFAEPAVRFNCLVVDTQLVDHDTYSGGDDELGFYKFYFQLLSRRLTEGCDYVIHVDHRNNREGARLPDLLRCVNRWWCKTRGALIEPVQAIRAADSKKEDLIQLCDVMLGAVGYTWNQHEGSPAKLDLVRHLEEHVGRRLNKGMPPHCRKFNVWDWRPTASDVGAIKKAP